MKLLTKIIVPALTVVIGLTGCANAPEPTTGQPTTVETVKVDTRNFNKAPEVVRNAIIKTGGISNWSTIRKIKGIAIVSDYITQPGKVTATQFKYIAKLTSNQIAKSITVDEIKNDNPLRFTAFSKDETLASCLGEKDSEKLYKGFFALVCDQLTGALNLLPANISAKDISKVRIHGETFIRIANRATKGAYYFDPKTSLLRFVTDGADKPGKLGTISIFTYKANAHQCELPESIEIRKIGDRVLLGNDQLFIIDLANTTFSTYAE